MQSAKSSRDLERAMQVRHVQDVGRILLDVEAEFGQLREAVRHSAAAGSAEQASAEIDEIIRKAESELRQKADLLLSSSLDAKLAQIPTAPSQPSGGASAAFRKGRVRKSPRTHSAGPASLAVRVSAKPQLARVGVKSDQISQLLNDFKARQDQLQPESTEEGRARQGTQGPPGRQRGGRHAVAGKQRPLGSSLARRNKIIENSAKASSPRAAAAEIGHSFYQDPAQLHPWAHQHSEAKARVALACDTHGLDASIKLDVDASLKAGGRDPVAAAKTHASRAPQASVQAVDIGQQALPTSQDRDDKSFTAKEESLGDSVLRLYEYESEMRAQGLYVFMVHNGLTLTRTSGFLAFKRAFEAEWGGISQLIAKVERIMQRYAVEVAYMDGGKLAALARDQLSRQTEHEIMTCVCNEDQVRSTVTLPGRAFTSGTEDAEDLAAAAIQATFRGLRERRAFKLKQSQNRAAQVIINIVRIRALQNSLARRLTRKRADEDAMFQALQRKFKDEWKLISASKRVVVHVPSLSYGEHLRLPIDRFNVLQNLQLSRLCDLAHRDVVVVYVAPMNLAAEVRKYYEKFLQLRGIANVAGRLHIVVPENAHRFPEHWSLAATLRYSPKAVAKIRGMVGTRPAYVLPNHVGEDDRMLALALQVPLFAPDPDVAALYSTKSGAKQIFADAEVNVPVGAYDLFEEAEVYSTLAKLVAANLDVDRWVLKIDDEFAGRGVALLDMAKFRFVQSVRADRARQTTKSHLGKGFWSRSDVQERARQQLEQGFRDEVKSRVVLQCPAVYPTWADFIVAFTKVGGVIEAVASDLVSSVSVCILIEPDGATRLLCTQDKLSSQQRSFQTVGHVFPQTLVPHAALRSASYAIAKTLYQRGVVGNVSVDFVAFVDPSVQSLRLWGLGLDLRMTQALATFRFFDFLLGGFVEDHSGMYKVSVVKESTSSATKEAKAEDPAEAGEAASCVEKELQTRAFASICPLHHPNFSTMTYAHFFSACRRHGISFDLQQAKGVAFELADSLSAGVVGALSIESDAAHAAIQLHRSFNFIHRFAGAYVQRALGDQEFDGTCTFSDALAVSKKLTAEIEEQFRQELEKQRNIDRAQRRVQEQQRQQQLRQRLQKAKRDHRAPVPSGPREDAGYGVSVENSHPEAGDEDEEGVMVQGRSVGDAGLLNR